MKDVRSSGRLGEGETILASYRAVLADHVPTRKRGVVLPPETGSTAVPGIAPVFLSKLGNGVRAVIQPSAATAPDASDFQGTGTYPPAARNRFSGGFRSLFLIGPDPARTLRYLPAARLLIGE